MASPFHLALALSFSSQLERILAEVARMARQQPNVLTLFHAGAITPSDKNRLEALLEPMADLSPQLVVREGDVVQEIIQYCRTHVVDLLVLGASQREGLLKYYFGSIDRDVCRKAPCSVLLLTRPQESPTGFPQGVMALKNRMEDLKLTDSLLPWVSLLNLQQLNFVVEQAAQQVAVALESDDMPESDPFMEALARQVQQHQALAYHIHEADGKAGHTACREARDKNADLLIMRAPDNDWVIFDRLFPQDIEYALADLPTNLLALRLPSA